MKQPNFNGFIHAARLERGDVPRFDVYPFCIPAVRHLERLEFHPAVTFFIGENGSGKSTLIEALAKDFLNRHERMLELLLSAEDENLKSKAR
jgi:predicted ATPase